MAGYIPNLRKFVMEKYQERQLAARKTASNSSQALGKISLYIVKDRTTPKGSGRSWMQPAARNRNTDANKNHKRSSEK